ncbi:hypothetical protein BH11ACT8_BH11ACT8_17480 [soil metagenome]
MNPSDAPGEEHQASQAERDALVARAEAAEQLAGELAAELEANRTALAEGAADHNHLSLFDDVGTDIDPDRAPDGSEPGVLPIALAAVATVAFLSALLSWANNGLLEVFTLLMLAVGTLFAWAAWSTRVLRVEVSVVDGVVLVVRGDDTHRFDLRNPATRVEVIGSPGDTDWKVRFYRRALEPCDVDARMVHAHDFLAKLREYRPEL